MLKCVTLTGADDSVNPKDLIKISKDYPFVEWGILVGSKTGTKFPSMKWIESFADAVENADDPVDMSLHICGKWLRDIKAGIQTEWPIVFSRFQRCQLNWHGEPQGDIGNTVLESFRKLAPWRPEIIFQLDGVNDDLYRPLVNEFRVSGLFDKSHGTGVSPDCWPQSHSKIPCGFAGGMGAENVTENLSKIIESCNPPSSMHWWIDMETKLFTGTQFDLSECRSVAEQVSAFIHGWPRGGFRQINRGVQ